MILVKIPAMKYETKTFHLNLIRSQAKIPTQGIVAKLARVLYIFIYSFIETWVSNSGSQPLIRCFKQKKKKYIMAYIRTVSAYPLSHEHHHHDHEAWPRPRLSRIKETLMPIKLMKNNKSNSEV